jgi:hypothetical protein
VQFTLFCTHGRSASSDIGGAANSQK